MIKYPLSTDGDYEECVPVDLDTSNFHRIKVIGRKWLQLYDTDTGKTHNCADYYQKYMESDE